MCVMKFQVARFFFGQRIKDATLSTRFLTGRACKSFLAFLRHAERGKYEGVRPERDQSIDNRYLRPWLSENGV